MRGVAQMPSVLQNRDGPQRNTVACAKNLCLLTMYLAAISPNPKAQVYWTKQHSRNAVAAKGRLRMTREEPEEEVRPARSPRPRAARADFKINVQSKRGERLQISVWRIGKSIFTNCGANSARQLCRGLELLITQSS